MVQSATRRLGVVVSSAKVRARTKSIVATIHALAFVLPETVFDERFSARASE
jgi:hypothetical protein